MRSQRLLKYSFKKHDKMIGTANYQLFQGIHKCDFVKNLR